MDIRNKVRIFKYKKEIKIVGRWFDSNNRNRDDQDLAVMVERLFYNGQLADWLGAGLQTLLGWFDSNTALKNKLL